MLPSGNWSASQVSKGILFVLTRVGLRRAGRDNYRVFWDITLLWPVMITKLSNAEGLSSARVRDSGR